MVARTYDEALRRVLEDEGGYSNDAADPGGPTNFGITIHDVRQYLLPGATAVDVRALTVDQAKIIYREHYAKPLRYDDLPPGVDYAVLDYGINSGIGRAARILQKLIGVPADGSIGPVTLAAVSNVDAADLVKSICDERLAFLQSLHTWSTFGKGWGRRVAGVRIAAVAMAGPATPANPLPNVPPSNFGASVIAAMRANNFELAIGPDVMNIIYVEGADPDGTPNDNAANKFNDVRMLVRVLAGGIGTILGKWEATTEPGRYWTEHPMNPGGAAHVALGQQTAWALGEYHGAPALVQAANLTIYRDRLRHYKREGQTYTSDDYGIHQHGGYNYPHDDLGRSSAGCLVGRLVDGHADFMRIVATDARVKAKRNFLWPTTILTAAQVEAGAASLRAVA